MSEILLNIKDRVLYLADIKEDNKQKFFRKAGINYSNFTGKSKESDLGSKYLSKIILTYPDINAEWLLTGKGSLLKTQAGQSASTELSVPSQNQDKQKLIALLEDKIRLLEENKTWQEKEIYRLKKKLTHAKSQLEECLHREK